jgi:hypothetical protein
MGLFNIRGNGNTEIKEKVNIFDLTKKFQNPNGHRSMFVVRV